MSPKLLAALSLAAAPLALAAPVASAQTIGSGIVPATIGNSAERPMVAGTMPPLRLS